MIRAYVDDDVFITQNTSMYTVSKNDTDVAHYNFNAYQPILIIFGRDDLLSHFS